MSFLEAQQSAIIACEPACHTLTVLAEEVGQRVQRGVKGEGRDVQRAAVHLARHLRQRFGQQQQQGDT